VTKGANPQNAYHIRQEVAKGVKSQKTPFRHSVTKGANPQNAYHIVLIKMIFILTITYIFKNDCIFKSSLNI
jgi:hypothetical protein